MSLGHALDLRAWCLPFVVPQGGALASWVSGGTTIADVAPASTPDPGSRRRHAFPPQTDPNGGSSFSADNPVGQAGRIVVHVQGNAFPFNMQPPFLIIDGYQMEVRKYGLNEAFVQPGQHRVELYSQSMKRYGFASIDVDVPEGGTVEVWYAVPAHMYARHGNIGLVPQRHPGMWYLGAVAVGFAIAVYFIVF